MYFATIFDVNNNLGFKWSFMIKRNSSLNIIAEIQSHLIDFLIMHEKHFWNTKVLSKFPKFL